MGKRPRYPHRGSRVPFCFPDFMTPAFEHVHVWRGRAERFRNHCLREFTEITVIRAAAIDPRDDGSCAVPYVGGASPGVRRELIDGVAGQPMLS